MFENVVLHLGAHKTATSLIQKYMRDRKEIFAENAIGFFYRPDGDKLIKWGAQKTIEASAAELNRRIEASITAGARHYILSEENAIGRPFVPGGDSLYPRASERGGNLQRALSGHSLKVIYYIRKQSAFVESYYLQTIHEGAHHSFAQWIQERGKPPTLSWWPVYKRLCDVFGAANVVLRSFEEEIAKGQAQYLRRFFASFARLDSAKLGNFEYEPVRNPSLGEKGLAIALAANKHLQTKQERRVMRLFLQKRFSNRHYPRPPLFSAEETKALSDRHDAENAELIQFSRAQVGDWFLGDTISVPEHRAAAIIVQSNGVARDAAVTVAGHGAVSRNAGRDKVPPVFTLPELPPTASTGPIDAVITWVDGADEAHAIKRARYQSKSVSDIAKKSTRFSDNDEIRYCLRGIRNHAPWLRTIWLVTDRQFPATINRALAEKEGVRVVSHQEIFSGCEELLPTFNSLSIETFIWRIPGLSERFIYFNDDMMLAAPVKPEDFFRDDRVVVRGTWKNWTAKPKKNLAHNLSNQIVTAKAAGVALERVWTPAHIAHPMRRTALEALYRSNTLAFRQNAEPRFRERSQWWIVSLHHNYLLLNGQAETTGSSELLHFAVAYCQKAAPERLKQRLKRLARHRVKFACLNLMEEIVAKVSDAYGFVERATGPACAFEMPRNIVQPLKKTGRPVNSDRVSA